MGAGSDRAGKAVEKLINRHVNEKNAFLYNLLQL
jgi:hypothetical protein